MSHGAQLGTLLLNEGLITQADLDAALEMQDSTGKPLGRILIEQGRISERDLVRTLANQVGLGFVDLDDILIDTAVTMLVPESLVRRYQAIPIHYDEHGRLVVTMAQGAPAHNFREANEFLLAEALFKMPKVFPLTD